MEFKEGGAKENNAVPPPKNYRWGPKICNLMHVKHNTEIFCLMLNGVNSFSQLLEQIEK